MARGKRFFHREFVYTGNHSAGENTVYEDGITPLMQYVGLDTDKMNEDWFLLGDLYDAEQRDGKGAAIVVNGYAVSIVKSWQSRRDSFGYTYEHTYRAERLA